MRQEDIFQIRCVKWLRIALPPCVVWSGIEHAGQLSIRAGAVRKMKGVRSGLPDLLIWHAGRCVGIELKTATGVQSDNQREFAERFRAAGCAYYLCRSEREVETALLAEGVPVRMPAPNPAPTIPKARKIKPALNRHHRPYLDDELPM